MTSVLSAVPYVRTTAGLHVKPTYDDVIQYIQKDPDKIKFPNRKAKILRNSPYLTQNDGFIELEAQNTQANNQQEQDMLLREFANQNNLILAQLQAAVQALNAVIRRGPMPQQPDGEADNGGPPQQPPPPPPPPANDAPMPPANGANGNPVVDFAEAVAPSALAGIGGAAATGALAGAGFGPIGAAVGGAVAGGAAMMSGQQMIHLVNQMFGYQPQPAGPAQQAAQTIGALAAGAAGSAAATRLMPQQVAPPPPAPIPGMPPAAAPARAQGTVIPGMPAPQAPQVRPPPVPQGPPRKYGPSAAQALRSAGPRRGQPEFPSAPSAPPTATTSRRTPADVQRASIPATPATPSMPSMPPLPPPAEPPSPQADAQMGTQHYFIGSPRMQPRRSLQEESRADANQRRAEAQTTMLLRQQEAARQELLNRARQQIAPATSTDIAAQQAQQARRARRSRWDPEEEDNIPPRSDRPTDSRTLYEEARGSSSRNRGRSRRPNGFSDEPPPPPPGPTADEMLDELIRDYMRNGRPVPPQAQSRGAGGGPAQPAQAYPNGAGGAPMAVPPDGFASLSYRGNPGRPQPQEQMVAIANRGPRGRQVEENLARQALPMNQAGRVDFDLPPDDDALLIASRQQARIDEINAIREASARNGASSSGAGGVQRVRLNKKTTPQNTVEAPVRRRLVRKTQVDKPVTVTFPDASQLNDDEIIAIRIARVLASKKRPMTDQQKQLFSHYKGKKLADPTKKKKGG